MDYQLIANSVNKVVDYASLATGIAVCALFPFYLANQRKFRREFQRDVKQFGESMETLIKKIEISNI